MDTQTFQAREMKEALALVRRQLGPDAIIVSTRKVQNGKMGVFSGHYYEVSAYSENPKGAKTQSGTSKKTQSASMSDDRNLSQPSEQISTGNYHKMKLALNRAKRLSEEPEQPVSRQIEQRPAAAIAAATGPLARVAPHAALRRRLLGALMPRELTERILSQLRTPPSHRAAAERELRHLLVTKTGSPAPLLAPGNRVVALVGPTGVGKTTTIAKLATHATIVEGKRVALISLDDHRVGAMAQLRAYAELLGTQLHACTSDQAFARALSAARDADIVFVDTPGIAPADQTGFQRLKERLARAGEHVTVHMCLSAATRQEELDRTVQLYQGLEPSAIIATKLDEAVAIGTIVAARLNLSLPLSYVTTGQQVPEDIEPASPVLLTDALLGAMSQ